MSNDKKFVVSSSPHILNIESTSSIMWTVIIFLLPAALFGVLIYGWYAGVVLLTSVLTSMGAEMLFIAMRKKDITVLDGSAALTGLLLGMSMPPEVPLYIPVISSFFAIGIVKHAFGGLGQNWANPAIAARVFAFIAWSEKMGTWKPPFFPDGTTAATPLGAISGVFSDSPVMYLAEKSADILKVDVSYFKMFLGLKSGCIGEVSILLLLIGAAYLIYRKIITIDIPLSYIGSFSILIWIFDGMSAGYFHGDVLFHLLTGGLILGAFFMATDMVTTPVTVLGRVIFGVGAGVITAIIRMYGNYPEGVSLAILFMNMLTPTIDRFIKLKPLGFEGARG